MLLSVADAFVAGQGGFDPSVAGQSTTNMRGWINSAIAEAVGKAKWLRQKRDFGPTVAGTAGYAVDPDVIQVRSLRVGSSRGWARCQLEDLWAIEGGEPWQLTGGAAGAFAPDWDDEADVVVSDDTTANLVRLFPVPDVDGLTVEAICSVMHPVIDESTDGSMLLLIPEDLARAIAVDGAVAMGLMYASERADLAAPFLARYTDAVGTLKGRANSRIGGGVQYAKVRR